MNLGKCLLHLYHPFRGVCVAASGLLLPLSIVLSITLIRGLNLPGTKYFSLVFNPFLAWFQTIFSKAKQNTHTRKSQQGKCQFDQWLAADSEGCSPSVPAQRGPVFAWAALSTGEALRPSPCGFNHFCARVPSKVLAACSPPRSTQHLTC